MINPIQTQPIEFKSCLAPWFYRFLQEKQTCGFRYARSSLGLRSFDRFLDKQGIQTDRLSQTIVEQWLSTFSHQTPRTVSFYHTVIRQLALFLIRNNVPAYIPRYKEGPIIRNNYVPWIFSHTDIQKLLAAVDSLPRYKQSPLRHLVFPEIFRLLYGCGLRANEALRLRIENVDLDKGVLTLKETKGGKERLVPLADSVRKRLVCYAERLGRRSPQASFFPAPDGGFYSCEATYYCFRQCLWQAGISHGGRGKGPRLHDLRHTFAVHRLIKWYREGVELEAKLPVLATYLGHKRLTGTQRYLHLTSELFPELTLNMEAAVGDIIPRRDKP